MGVGTWCGADAPRTYADNIQMAEDSLQLHHFGPRDFDRAFFHFLLPGKGSLTRTQIDYALFTILGIKLDDMGQRNYEEYLKIFEDPNEPSKFNFERMIRSMYLLSGKRTVDKAANFFRLYDTEGSGGKYYLTPERFEKLVEELCEIIYITTRHFCDISPSTFDFHRKEFEDDRRKLYERAVEIIYQKGQYDKVSEEQFLNHLMSYETQVGYPILSAAGIRKRTLKFLYTEVKRVSSLETQTAETRLPMYPTGPRKENNGPEPSMLRMLPANLTMPSSPSGELRVFGSPLRKQAP